MNMQSYKETYTLLIKTLIMVCICLAGIALLFGTSGLGFNKNVMFFRLTRIILIIIAGSSLAASGATLQTVFQNPLADPHLFGIAGGASVGAAIALSLFSSYINVGPIIGAVIGSIITFIFIYYYLNRSNEQMLSYCLLIGILINSVAASLITLLKLILPAHKTTSLLFWLVGHISIVNKHELLIIIGLWAIGLSILFNIRSKLEILSFGSEEGFIVGIDSQKLIKQTIIANSILIGNVVSFAGIIGFLGLVIPHLLRITFTADLRFLLPLATIVGAIALIIFDTLGKVSYFMFNTEIPIGATSALVLAPIFFAILIKDQNGA